MGQDEALVDENFVLDLDVLSHDRHALDSDPLPDYALPSYDTISDEGMSFDERFAHDAGVREADTSRNGTIFSDDDVRSNYTRGVNLCSRVNKDVPNYVITFRQFFATLVFQVLEVIFCSCEKILGLPQIHPEPSESTAVQLAF